VFDDEAYFRTLGERLQRHFHNYGRYNLSVAGSSHDTWLDGYVPGAPYRKTSIYDEGCLIAFLLDVRILRATSNKKSLRDVCRLLYRRFGKTGKGYTAADVVSLVSEISGSDENGFISEFVFSPSDYREQLSAAFDYLGIELSENSTAASDEHYGFKVTETAGPAKVTLVAPFSPAWKAGLFAGDEIIAVNGVAVRGNLNQWLNYFRTDGALRITGVSGEAVREFLLEPDRRGQRYFLLPKLRRAPGATAAQKEAFESWKSR
jgi:predicted metalloprotease with PDZ domain